MIYVIALILIVFLLYTLYKPTIDLVDNPDIILSPGGLLGFYVLGICHFIKNNYDITNKKIIGFSAGSFNNIFLALNKNEDVLFLSKLFKLNLDGNMSLSYLLDKMTDIVNENYTIDYFDTTHKYMALTTNYNKLEGYNTFLTTNQLTNCCIASSFIPFITYKDLFFFYNGKSSMDGGFLYNKYKKQIHSKKTLWLNYNTFHRYKKYSFPGYSLLHKNCSIYQLYILGYNDAIQNKSMLDYYLNI